VKPARRFRKLILAAGSEKPARQMVKQFLGRNFRIDQFAAWLNEGSGLERTAHASKTGTQVTGSVCPRGG